VDAFVRAADDVAQQQCFPADWSLPTAYVGAAVFARFGLTGAHAVGVRVLAMNEPASQLYRDGVPREQWPAQAHVTGCNSSGLGDETGWDGHVAVYLPATSDDQTAMIVDVILGQFSAPHLSIALCAMATYVPSTFLGGTPVLFPMPVPGIVHLAHVPTLYLPEPRPEAREWLCAFADEVERRMRDTLGLGGPPTLVWHPCV